MGLPLEHLCSGRLLWGIADERCVDLDAPDLHPHLKFIYRAGVMTLLGTEYLSQRARAPSEREFNRLRADAILARVCLQSLLTPGLKRHLQLLLPPREIVHGHRPPSAAEAALALARKFNRFSTELTFGQFLNGRGRLREVFRVGRPDLSIVVEGMLRELRLADAAFRELARPARTPEPDASARHPGPGKSQAGGRRVSSQVTKCVLRALAQAGGWMLRREVASKAGYGSSQSYVGDALRVLRAAGLVEMNDTDQYAITDKGREVLKAGSPQG